jgi:hypothetical protein
MKIVILALTIVIHFLVILKLKFLDHFNLIIILFLISLTIGLTLRITDTNKKNLYQFGWGLFYGSLISLAVTTLFTIWLSFNFPR